MALCSAAALAEAVVFRHALTDAPLDVVPGANEVETDQVKSFKQTGTNPYRGNEAALAQGKQLYSENCGLCHLPDGTGRIGPSLVGTDWSYPRVATDIGMFEVVYGGASGAMQSFAMRGMAQDDMLKIIAYVRSLAKP